MVAPFDVDIRYASVLHTASLMLTKGCRQAVPWTLQHVIFDCSISCDHGPAQCDVDKLQVLLSYGTRCLFANSDSGSILQMGSGSTRH